MIAQLLGPFLHRKSLLLMVKLIAIYLVFALPFSAMEFIPGLTNLRPVTTLIPIYGIFFGPAGMWAYAIGNILYDCLSGTLVVSSIGGFVGNFVAAGLFWALTQKLVDEQGRFSGSIRAILMYQLVAVAASVVVAGAVMFFVAGFMQGVDASMVGISIIANDLFFMLMPGAGLCVLLSTSMRLTPALLKGEAGE